MKAIEKIELLDKIAVSLQSRMTYAEIDLFFTAHGVEYSGISPSANSKRVYAREVLAKEKDEVILRIADELEISHHFSVKTAHEATFWKPGYFRLFISHLASFKVQTSHLQAVLKKYAISAFVAHEDIEPSREWQQEIEAGLHTMDALAAILMPGFKESNWCDQELGVAVGRDVLIIPVRKGMDPYGFIGKYQGIQGQNKKVGEVAEQIFKTIVKSPKTRAKMILSLCNAISQSTDVDAALEQVSILKSIESIATESLENLKTSIKDNNVLSESELFTKRLNEVLAKFGVAKLTMKEVPAEQHWDDIPF